MPDSHSRLIGEHDVEQLVRISQRDGLGLQTGAMRVRLRSDVPEVRRVIHSLYRYHRLRPQQQWLADFHIYLERPRGLRRWWRPQVIMHSDAKTPFEPFRLDHAYPLFEWSFNWTIAMNAHQFLLLHAAVVEKDGVAVIMPALPGSGKSTLCSALMLKGWRLLSDEFGIIRPSDNSLSMHPLPRPIPLKNASIDVIRNFSPDAVLGPTYPETRKGAVAHLMATEQSQRNSDQPAPAGWLLFPLYQAGAELHIESVPKAHTFLKLSGNSFNYKLQGARGFQTVTTLVNRCPAYQLRYSDLNSAIDRIETLHAQVIDQHASGAIPRAQ